MHLIVAFVNSFILSSVSMVPSQCADTKPPLFSMAALNSSNVETCVVCAVLKSIAFVNKFSWISSNKFSINTTTSSCEMVSFDKVN